MVGYNSSSILYILSIALCIFSSLLKIKCSNISVFFKFSNIFIKESVFLNKAAYFSTNESGNWYLDILFSPWSSISTNGR